MVFKVRRQCVLAALTVRAMVAVLQYGIAVILHECMTSIQGYMTRPSSSKFWYVTIARCFEMKALSNTLNWVVETQQICELLTEF